MRGLLDEPSSKDSSNGQDAERSATLLRSLLTDKGPAPPVTQASGSDSGTSSVDLGLITLAMLAVKSAAKNSDRDSQDQNKVGRASDKTARTFIVGWHSFYQTYC